MIKDKNFNVFLQGGLGNQLYIYIFFRWLKQNFKFLNITYNNEHFYNDDKFSRKYKLDKLGLEIKIDNSKKIKKYFSIKSFFRYYRIISNLLFGPNASLIVEEKFFSIENIIYYLKNNKFKSKNYFVIGYWQFDGFNYKYSDQIKYLRNQFSKTVNIDQRLRSIDLSKTVGLHIRSRHKGIDFNINSFTEKINFALSKFNIYDKVILVVAQDQVNFFQMHIQKNIVRENIEVYFLNGSDIEDMYNLSLCNFLVLTNKSTYSDWISYLSCSNSQNLI